MSRMIPDSACIRVDFPALLAPNTPTICASPQFSETLFSPTAESFCWQTPTDSVVVRGPLSEVGSYTIDSSLTLVSTACVDDVTIPAGGQGFYYLVRPDCAVGSWQTSAGAEPNRDVAIPN